MATIGGVRTAALALAMAAAACGAEMRWSELARVVEGRKAEVKLADGSRVKGRVVGVSPEGLRMVAGNGEVLVPRREVKEMRVSRTTKKWRIIGTAIGAGAGLPPTVVLNTYLNNEVGSSPAVILGVAVPAAVGYLAGWSIDRKRTDVKVIPEP